MILRARFHGRGGQGVKTSSRILGTAAFLEGYFAQDFPMYGPERRGAPVTAYTRISDTPIRERGYILSPDIVVVADETLLRDGSVGVLDGLKPGGVVAINAASKPPILNFRTVTLDVTGISLPVIGKASVSAGIASMASKVTGLIKLDSVLRATRKELEELGLREELIGKNLALAEECYNATPPVKALTDEEASTQDSELVEVVSHDADLAIATITSTANTYVKKTGNWRMMRPVINYQRCTKCMVCYVYCPESCITLDGTNTPYIDYDNCKGCLICYTECPPKCISIERELRVWEEM